LFPRLLEKPEKFLVSPLEGEARRNQDGNAPSTVGNAHRHSNREPRLPKADFIGYQDARF
jgi:hypothetical protein